MATHKNINIICIVIAVIGVALTVLFMNAGSLGIVSKARTMGYEDRLFDIDRVHTIAIVMDDWEELLENATSEQYYNCNVIIDNELYKNVAIRGKGNTSLSSVASMDSDRYSFKIEFDHYDNTKTYHGLDKLCLNNTIQDSTYMKDFLAYQMMGKFGVDAPLCSFAYITVNGEDWGLYLAVEGVEDAFLQRNYGTDIGDLYKPDSQSNGGGKGNGGDFDMSGFMKEEFGEDWRESVSSERAHHRRGSMSGNEAGGMGMPGGMGSPGDMGGSVSGNFAEGSVGMPGDMGSVSGNMAGGPGGGGMGGGPGGGGMGSDDVKLKYVDDDPESYSNIFSSAKTDVSDADQTRLIASLKTLSSYEDLESVLEMDKVIRYFVVHDFVVNGDSYTGSMIHNYYLYEKDSKMRMIPWDYNLAYGTFQGNDAQSAVNDPIDTPVSGGEMDDRPMVGWIFSNETYTEQYHTLYREFLEQMIDSGYLLSLIDSTAEMIAPYVEKDPTQFYTYEEFQAGVPAIRSFCELRARSIAGQLDGTIPSTEDGQSEDSSALIDTGDLELKDMGSMSDTHQGGGEGGGPGGGGNMGGMGGPGGGGNMAGEGGGPGEMGTMSGNMAGDPREMGNMSGNEAGFPDMQEGMSSN